MGHAEPPSRPEANFTGPESYVCTGRDWPLEKIKPLGIQILEDIKKMVTRWCCLKKKVGVGPQSRSTPMWIQLLYC